MKINSHFLIIILLAALTLSACNSPAANPTPLAVTRTTEQTVPQTATQPPSAPLADSAGTQPTATGAAISESTAVPDCASPAAPSPALTEGPYYKAGSPERSSLFEQGMPGIRLILSGYVLDTNCQPVANAWLDFWQADANGAYDNTGYTLRGHQFTDETGRYQLETVVPGLYPGRTEHIHVKVQAPDGPVLTTQLFFPGVTNNESDRIYAPELVITVVNDSGDSIQAEFNFVVKVR